MRSNDDEDVPTLMDLNLQVLDIVDNQEYDKQVVPPLQQNKPATVANERNENEVACSENQNTQRVYAVNKKMKVRQLFLKIKIKSQLSSRTSDSERDHHYDPPLKRDSLIF